MRAELLRGGSESGSIIGNSLDEFMVRLGLHEHVEPGMRQWLQGLTSHNSVNTVDLKIRLAHQSHDGFLTM